jgi:hypothetical protein
LDFRKASVDSIASVKGRGKKEWQFEMMRKHDKMGKGDQVVVDAALKM